MTKPAQNITPEETRVLAALKKDPRTVDELAFFANGVDIANRLVELGLANVFRGIYSISQAGHKYKPTEVFNQASEQPVKLSSKVETISLNAVIEIKKPAPKPAIQQPAITSSADNPKVKSQKIAMAIKLIGEKGTCTGADIRQHVELGNQSVANLLKTATLKSRVIVTEKDGVKYYSLPDQTPKPNPIAQETPAMTTELNPQNDVEIDPTKSRVWRMVKLIFQQGKADAKQLCELVKERYPSNIPYLVSHVCTGENAVIEQTRTVDDDGKVHYTYKPFAGKTFDDYLNLKGGAHKGKTKPKTATPVQPYQVEDIPQFLRKTDDLSANSEISNQIYVTGRSLGDGKYEAVLAKSDDLAVADSVDKKLGLESKPSENQYQFIKNGDDNFFNEADRRYGIPDESAKLKIENLTRITSSKFKAAITSAGTIMLFGINEAPIELTNQDTRTLCHFICNADLDGLLV